MSISMPNVIRRSPTYPVYASGKTATDAATAGVPTTVSATPPDDTIPLSGNRSVGFIFYSTSGAVDGNTFFYQLWAIRRIVSSDKSPNEPATYLKQALNTSVDKVTISTFKGSSLTNYWTSTTLVADTISGFTKTAYATALEKAFGFSIETSSPANNTPAELFVTDCGDVWGLYLDIWGDAATTSLDGINALVTLSV